MCQRNVFAQTCDEVQSDRSALQAEAQPSPRPPSRNPSSGLSTRPKRLGVGPGSGSGATNRTRPSATVSRTAGDSSGSTRALAGSWVPYVPYVLRCEVFDRRQAHLVEASHRLLRYNTRVCQAERGFMHRRQCVAPVSLSHRRSPRNSRYRTCAVETGLTRSPAPPCPAPHGYRRRGCRSSGTA